MQEEEAKERITELGLRYSLMSAYTSFVAIDSEVRNPGGEGQTVSVPVPLPDQVSPLAAPGHAYVTGNAVKYKAQEALSGFLCRKQAAPSTAGIGRDERALSPGSSADAALPAELEEKDSKEDDTEPGIREIRIRGTLNEEEVRTVLEAALEAWVDEEDLAHIRGPVTLALVVDEDGKVARAWVRNKETLDEEDLRVLLEHARDLSFPETRGTFDRLS